MLAILFALAQAPPMVVAANTRVEGLQVTAPRDSNLVSRTFYSDGTIGECRRVFGEKAGWLTVECRSGIFLGRDVYEPVKADPDRGEALAPSLSIDNPPDLRTLH
jgi:hypothetical protein